MFALNTNFLWYFISISGALSVCLGAFASHSLKARLSLDMLQVFQTGVYYQLTHSIALGVIGLLLMRTPDVPALHWSATFMMLGIVLFSGSLYLLSLFKLRLLGPVTPIGGLCLILAWVSLIFAVKYIRQ